VAVGAAALCHSSQPLIFTLWLLWLNHPVIGSRSLHCPAAHLLDHFHSLSATILFLPELACMIPARPSDASRTLGLQPDPQTPAGPSDSSRTHELQPDPQTPAGPSDFSRTHELQPDPQTPAGPLDSSRTLRLQPDPQTSAGPSDFSRTLRLQPDPQTPGGPLSERSGDLLQYRLVSDLC